MPSPALFVSRKREPSSDGLAWSVIERSSEREVVRVGSRRYAADVARVLTTAQAVVAVQVIELPAARPARKRGRRTGQRRNVAAHINEVMKRVRKGTFVTASEIAAMASTEYGEDRPGIGAVYYRLKAGTDLAPGIIPAKGGVSGAFGALRQ